MIKLDETVWFMGREMVVTISTAGQSSFHSSNLREVNLSQNERSISGEIG